MISCIADRNLWNLAFFLGYINTSFHPLRKGRKSTPTITGMFSCCNGLLYSQGMSSRKMPFRYMHHLLELDSEIWQHILQKHKHFCGKAAEGYKNWEFTQKAYQRPTTKSTYSRGQKTSLRGTSRSQLCCDKLARWETTYVLLSI